MCLFCSVNYAVLFKIKIFEIGTVLTPVVIPPFTDCCFSSFKQLLKLLARSGGFRRYNFIFFKFKGFRIEIKIPINIDKLYICLFFAKTCQVLCVAVLSVCMSVNWSTSGYLIIYRSSQIVESWRDQLSACDDRQQLKAFPNNGNEWFDCWRADRSGQNGGGAWQGAGSLRRGALIVPQRESTTPWIIMLTALRH